MEIFFNGQELEKEGIKDCENQKSRDHSLETVTYRKSEDQQERQFIAWGKRTNSRKTSSNTKNQSCGGGGD